MNTSIFVIAIGAVLLFISATMWVGLALLAIGTVVYMLERKPPLPAAVPKHYRGQMQPEWPYQYQMPEQPQAEGFSAGIRDQGTYEMGHGGLTRQQTPKGPYMDGGNLNLPLPLPPEIQDYIDLKYTKPVKGKNVSMELDRDSSLIPKF